MKKSQLESDLTELLKIGFNIALNKSNELEVRYSNMGLIDDHAFCFSIADIDQLGVEGVIKKAKPHPMIRYGASDNTIYTPIANPYLKKIK